MSENDKNVPQVYAAISQVTAEMARIGIAKGRTNTQQNYKFRGIDEFLDALAPVLPACKLCVLPRIVEREQVERTSAKGGQLFYTTLTADFDFVCVADGSKHTVRTVGEAMDSGDKSSNKAMSAAYKYAVMLTFAIPIEGTPDADEQSHDVQQLAPVEQRAGDWIRSINAKATADEVKAVWKSAAAMCQQSGDAEAHAHVKAIVLDRVAALLKQTAEA